MAVAAGPADAGAEDPPAAPDAPGLRLHLLLPAAVTVALAFHAGGYFPGATAAAAAVLVVLAALRVAVGRSPFAGWSAPLAVMTGALALLAVWTLISALWSEAAWRAVAEFDRALLYLLLAAIVGSFAVRAGDLDRLFAALALAIFAVAGAALLTRLAPGTFPIETGAGATRLSFPLTYWNALGALCAIGVVLGLHATSGARQGLVARALGAAVMPVIATALYFTFSRGAIIAGAGGVLLYVVLAHPRRLLPALPALLPAGFAVLTAYGEDGLQTAAEAAGDPAADRLLLTLVVCSGAAVVLRLLAFPLDRAIERPRVGRRTRAAVLGGAVLVAVLAVGIVAVGTDYPDRAADEVRAFLEDAPSPVVEDQRDRLTSFRSNGRVAQWEVAWRAFEGAPVAGTGAGTYRVEWEEAREQTGEIQDAHGLFVEMLGELGLPGLLLLLVAVGTPIALALRRLAGPERHAHAAFVAAAATLLVHAQVDWDWEMPAVFGWVFAAGGMVCAARARTAPAIGPPRPIRLVAAVACLLLALLPASVWLSQRELDRATRAFRAGDCRTAVDAGLASLGRFNARPEPFELLGYCDLRAGQEELGVAAMRAARQRDPRDWQYAYGEAVALAVAGGDPRPALAEARSRNPLEVLPQELSAAIDGAPRRRWPRLGAAATLPAR